MLMEAVGLSKLRWAQASASEVGAIDLADGTRGAVDDGRSGAGGVKLRGVDDRLKRRRRPWRQCHQRPR